MRVIPTRSQEFAPAGEGQRETRGDLKAGSFGCLCHSQGREEKREILNISSVSGGWRCGMGRELKGKGPLWQVEGEGAPERVWVLRGEVSGLTEKESDISVMGNTGW